MVQVIYYIHIKNIKIKGDINMPNIHNKAVRITINVTEKDLEFLDMVVNEKIFLSRTDCLRTLLREYKSKYELKKEIKGC